MTILRFRHLLEKHYLAVDMLRVVNDLRHHRGLMLRSRTAMDAPLLSPSNPTKDAEFGKRPAKSS